MDEALKRAYDSRSDLQAAQANVRAAEYSRQRRSRRALSHLSFTGDYGDAGQHFDSSHGVFDVRGTVNVPLFTGGAVHGDVVCKPTPSFSRRATGSKICAARSTPTCASPCSISNPRRNWSPSRKAISILPSKRLTQSRDRFAAGVTDTVEVVQSQEAVATAHQNYISSLYSYNYAKISLARAMGAAEEGVKEYFKGK